MPISRFRHSLRAGLLAGAALASAEPAAFAQRAPDVIVVTATRGEEGRDAVAAPVAVLEAEEIARLGAHHIAEALNRLPGVFIHRGSGTEHLTAIRSAVLTGGAGAGSFLYLEDGVPMRAPGFANINGLMEAVDGLAGRIEVIRGPGSAVYGSNALHGLVNVRTPEPLEAGRLAELEAGSFGRVRARAFSGGQTRLGAAWGGLSVRHEDGWREESGLTEAGVQARLDGQAGRTDWSLRMSAIDIDQETATFVDGFRAYEDEAASRRNADPLAFRDAQALRASLHLERDFTEALSGTAVIHGRSNDMALRLHFLPSLALERTGHDSLGAQTALVREGEHGRVILGADADLTRGYLYEFQERPTVGPFVQGLHYDYTVDALVLAGFVQGRRKLAEGLSLEGGLRIERTEFDYVTRAPEGAEGRFLRPADRSDDFMSVTPNLGLVWVADERLTLFARAARGARAPQTAELYRLQPGQVIAGIEPEVLDSLEAGTRVFLGERGRVELTGFAMDKRNVFFRDADGFNVTDGATRHHGLELDAAMSLTETLSLAASVSWAVHEYAFDRPVRSGSEAIRDGDRLDTAPEWLGNARLLWEPAEGRSAELEWIHVGPYFADAGNTARYDGHDVLNVRLAWTLASGLEAFGTVRNLADVRYAERADFAFGDYRYFPAEPRSVSLGVRLRAR